MVGQKLLKTTGQKRWGETGSQGRSRLFSVQFIIVHISHSTEHSFESCKITYNHSVQKHDLSKSIIIFSRSDTVHCNAL